jgi:predicted nucleic acid-binding protein
MGTGMIVADTNILTYLLLPGEKMPLAEKALQQDPDWAAPALWRSEFLNMLAVRIHRSEMTVAEALAVFAKAEAIIAHREFTSIPERVLRLVAASNCSAYDCEYVALAEDIRSPLITTDTQILKAFPKIAVSLEKFTA